MMKKLFFDPGFCLITFMSLFFLDSFLTRAMAVTMTGSITGLMGDSTYPRQEPGTRLITVDADFTLEKMKTANGTYIIDPTATNTITFRLVQVSNNGQHFGYVTSPIKINYVRFGDDWEVQRINFNGPNTLDSQAYDNQGDLITMNTNRRLTLQGASIRGFFDFENQRGQTLYIYKVTGVTDISDPQNPKRIEPIPNEYNRGQIADSTNFRSNSIPTPDQLSVMKVPEPLTFLGSFSALAFAALCERELSKKKNSKQDC